jgi:hypothetical protein
MGCDFLCSPLSYEVAIVAAGFVAYCYGTTLKHLMASRCTSISLLGCIKCDRLPLGDAAACDVVESSSPEIVVSDGGPVINLSAVTI